MAGVAGRGMQSKRSIVRIVSEPDGKPSYARVVGVVAASLSMALATWVTLRSGQMSDVPTGWLALAVLPYGVGKLVAVVRGVRGG